MSVKYYEQEQAKMIEQKPVENPNSDDEGESNE